MDTINTINTTNTTNTENIILESIESNIFVNNVNNVNEKKVIQKEKFKWESLDNIWVNILLSDNFKIKNCQGDGNCQFRSIEQALKKDPSVSEKTLNHRDLRNIVADYIDKEMNVIEFKTMLNSYILEKQNNEFLGKWDPFKIKTKMQFIKQIKKAGFNFQGDYITLNLLSKALNIDFIILNENGHNIIKVTNDNANKIILLNYIKNNGHYKTIGLNNSDNDKNIQTVFFKDNLPIELEPLFNRSLFITKHLRNNINKVNFTLPQIISLFKEITTNLSLDDYKIIAKEANKIISENKKENNKIFSIRKISFKKQQYRNKSSSVKSKSIYKRK